LLALQIMKLTPRAKLTLSVGTGSQSFWSVTFLQRRSRCWQSINFCGFDANPDPDLDLTTNFFPNLDPPMLQKDPLRLPSFHFDADLDLDPAFHFHVDPDPGTAFHFDGDPDPGPAFHFDGVPDPAFYFDADPDPQHCYTRCHS
jgi:hypothetical protein